MKKCLNCQQMIPDDAQQCPYCSADCSNDSDYVLLTSEGIASPKANSQKKEKRRGAAMGIAIFILIAAIICAGLFYFEGQKQEEKRELSFSTGTGVINDDQKVIFVTFDDSSKVEYIHGVSLYDGDYSKKTKISADPLSSDYEYTKSVDGSFRAIMFYADDLNIKDDKSYVYTFSIKLSFVGGTGVYTYNVANSFSGNIKDDASEKVFDHSLAEETTTVNTTKKADSDDSSSTTKSSGE